MKANPPGPPRQSTTHWYRPFRSTPWTCADAPVANKAAKTAIGPDTFHMMALRVCRRRRLDLSAIGVRRQPRPASTIFTSSCRSDSGRPLAALRGWAGEPNADRRYDGAAADCADADPACLG